MTRVLYPNRFALYFFAIVAVFALGVYYYVQMMVIDAENSAQEQLLITQSESAKKSTSSVDTTGWKTYRNEKYGFEFKYPESMDRGGEQGVSVSTTKIPAGYKDLKVFLESKVKTPGASTLDSTVTLDRKNIAGQEIFLLREEMPLHGNLFKAFFERGSELFLIEYNATYGAENPLQEDSVLSFDHLISHLTFFRATQETPVDTTGWKTYRNEKYGFELQYPPEWRLAIDKDRIFSFTARDGLKGEFFLDKRSTVGPSGDYGRKESSVFLGTVSGLEDGGAACEYESNLTNEPCYFRANYVSSDTAQRGFGFALGIRNIPDSLVDGRTDSSWVYFEKEIKVTRAALSTLIFLKAAP